MKGKQIFYWLSLLLCLAVAGCSSDGEDEVTPKDEPGEEGGGEQTGREVWSFDVKVMLDRATFKSYGSSANVVNNKLKQRFKEVRELYHGKKGITYFDADIEFVPFLRRNLCIRLFFSGSPGSCCDLSGRLSLSCDVRR